MWRAGSLSNLNKRTQARIVSKFIFETGDLCMIDIGDDLKLPHAGLEPGKGLSHRFTDNAASLTHIVEFCLGLHQPGPVNNLVVIRNDGIGQAIYNMLMGPGSIVMCIEFHPNPAGTPATGYHQLT